MKFNKVKTGFSIQSENFRHSITSKKFQLWLYRNEWEFSLPVKYMYINAIACIHTCICFLEYMNILIVSQQINLFWRRKSNSPLIDIYIDIVQLNLLDIIVLRFMPKSTWLTIDVTHYLGWNSFIQFYCSNSTSMWN